MDTDFSGTISKEELLETYKNLFKAEKSEKEIIAEVNEIWARIDIDNSGRIDFSEWMIGAANKHEILNAERLKKAFDMFDKVKFKLIIL